MRALDCSDLVSFCFHFKKVRLAPFPNNKNIEKIMKQIEIEQKGDINRTKSKKKQKI